MNDSFRTDVFVRYQPETIACACIYLAARQLQICLPSSPAWFGLFQVDEEEIQQICLTLLYLYSRKKPNYEELEKVVEKAKKQQIEAKQKAKGYATPNSVSTQNSPKTSSPSVALVAGVKRIKTEDEPLSDSDKANRNGKKRHRSDSEGTTSPQHRSRSRSRSSRSRSSRSYSRSPKRRNKSPRKLKKDKRSPSHHKEKHGHKKKRRTDSRSRSRSYTPSPDRYKSKRYHKDKDRYAYSPDRYSRKHRNGHRSPIRDRYDKYDKYRR